MKIKNVDEKAERKEIIEEPNQQVYVIERGENDVKIGVSKNFEKRKRAIEKQAGFVATRYFAGTKLSNGRTVENAVQMKFADKRNNGEWFSVSFEDAVSAIIEATDALGEAIIKRTDLSGALVLGAKMFALPPEPSPMETMKKDDPWLYQWCVHVGCALEDTEQGLGVNMPFPDGHCEFVSFDLFCMIAECTWDLLDYFDGKNFKIPPKKPGEEKVETALDYMSIAEIQAYISKKKLIFTMAKAGFTYEEIEDLLNSIHETVVNERKQPK